MARERGRQVCPADGLESLGNGNGGAGCSGEQSSSVLSIFFPLLRSAYSFEREMEKERDVYVC